MKSCLFQERGAHGGGGGGFGQKGGGVRYPHGHGASQEIRRAYHFEFFCNCPGRSFCVLLIMCCASTLNCSQGHAYKHCMEDPAYNWIGFIDTDEFLVITDPNVCVSMMIIDESMVLENLLLSSPFRKCFLPLYSPPCLGLKHQRCSC